MMPTRLRARSTSAPIAAALAAAVLLCCTACMSGAPSGSGATASPSATTAPSPAAPSPSATGASAPAAARAERLRVDAALGHRVAWLEYLCSVPSGRDQHVVYVALHERTTWQASGTTSSLDAVLAQPVRAAAGGGWAVAGSPVTIRSVRDRRLASDAIVGLVGPDHRCSASYIGPPVTG
ncbi:MAG TPA: hypothetical protein VGO26_04540 [Amnibacterium sp.]|jgi:hypothetical protein|nr:hypothetical protein [Amnibacterium sp.]